MSSQPASCCHSRIANLLWPSSASLRQNLRSQLCCRHFISRNTTRHRSALSTSSISVSTPPETHYTLFPRTLPSGPPPAAPFAIDLRSLRSEYLRLQASAHPDRHASITSTSSGAASSSRPNRTAFNLPAAAAGATTRATAEAASTRINEAYRTLQDPLRRAVYLLQLRGVDVDAEASQGSVSAELLVEVMGVREEIETLEEGERNEVWEAERTRLKRENEERVLRGVEELEKVFVRDELVQAREVVVTLRYWMGVRESLEALDD